MQWQFNLLVHFAPIMGACLLSAALTLFSFTASHFGNASHEMQCTGASVACRLAVAVFGGSTQGAIARFIKVKVDAISPSWCCVVTGLNNEFEMLVPSLIIQAYMDP
jgi:hypothetical protein